MTYKQLVESLIKEIESEGLLPWEIPWHSGEIRNIKGNAYRGMNSLLLGFYCRSRKFKSPYFLTRKQAREIGGDIKESELERFFSVVFFNPARIQYAKIQEDEIEPKDKEDEKPTIKSGEWKIQKHSFLRVYSVYNVEQTEGINLSNFQNEKTKLKPVELADHIVEGYKNRPQITAIHGKAYYNPIADIVCIPPLRDYDTTEAFYSTAFHELIHSTGHKSRLNRIKSLAFFGSHDYSQEELVAECGASFLLNMCNMLTVKEHRQSSAYLQSWLCKLREKTALLWQSAAKAQKAVDWILGRSYTESAK